MSKRANKGGRPKKKDQLKDVSHSIRFTHEEEKVLSEKVAQFGGTLSDYLRKAAFNTKIVSVITPEIIKLFKTYRQTLINIGVNINAIARRANTDKIVFDERVLNDAIKECHAIIKLCIEMQNKTME